VVVRCGVCSMWSGLFPPVRRYHCFGDAYMKSEVLAARSRPYRVRVMCDERLCVCDEGPVCAQSTRACVLWAGGTWARRR